MTTDNDHDRALQEELERFRKEKEKVRALIGQVGGKGSARRDKIANIVFLVAIVVLFAVDVTRHLLGIHVPLPPLFSLEIGILLVSIKVIWMIHKQSRVEHFQFWILNSIEFRVTELARKMRNIEKKLG